MLLQPIAQTLEQFAPRELQESYDNAGLQCGMPHQEVSRVLTCLDITEQVVEEAHQQNCQLIISHHPLLFHGVKVINPEADYISRILMAAIRYGIGIYSAHTNLDKAEGGMNHSLAALLGMTDVQSMSECGVIGRLPRPMTADELLHHIRQTLHGASLRYNRDAYAAFGSGTSYAHPASGVLRHLALCTGSGADFIDEARSLHADAYLTGEMHYHSCFGHPDLLIIEAGHYETEQHAPQLIADILHRSLPELEVLTTQCAASPTMSL